MISSKLTESAESNIKTIEKVILELSYAGDAGVVVNFPPAKNVQKQGGQVQ